MLFSNSFDSGYDELISYYPQYYREVREMKAILQAHGYLIDGLTDGFERVLANCFIDTMDEDIIKALEDCLDIKIYRQRSLEDRRGLLKSFFIGNGKISASLIEEMIMAYTGASVECTFEPFDDEGNNFLEIAFARGSKEVMYISDVEYLLAKKIPAHIYWEMSIAYPFVVVVVPKRHVYKNEFRYCGEAGLCCGSAQTP